MNIRGNNWLRWEIDKGTVYVFNLHEQPSEEELLNIFTGEATKHYDAPYTILWELTHADETIVVLKYKRLITNGIIGKWSSEKPGWYSVDKFKHYIHIKF